MARLFALDRLGADQGVGQVQGELCCLPILVIDEADRLVEADAALAGDDKMGSGLNV